MTPTEQTQWVAALELILRTIASGRAQLAAEQLESLLDHVRRHQPMEQE